MPNGKSFGDRRDSAVGSVLEPAASICDFFATARRPDDDRFLLVVISVAYVCLRILRTEYRSCDTLSMEEILKIKIFVSIPSTVSLTF